MQSSNATRLGRILARCSSRLPTAMIGNSSESALFDCASETHRLQSSAAPAAWAALQELCRPGAATARTFHQGGESAAAAQCIGSPTSATEHHGSPQPSRTAIDPTLNPRHAGAALGARAYATASDRPQHVAAALGRRASATESDQTLHLQHVGAARGGRAYATESKLDKFELFSSEEGLTRIDGCSDTGFLVNDVMVEGPLLCFRNAFLCWHVASLAAVTPSSLSAAFLLVPSPDIIVFGTGEKLQPLPPDTAKRLTTLGIGFETCGTANAMATFNILAQEGRHVVGVFLPLNKGASS